VVVASVGVTDDAGLGEAVATDVADKATGTDLALSGQVSATVIVSL
jgi:hypothetical protein